MTDIDRSTLKRDLDAGEPIVLLEALPPKYFREGHLPGARQIDAADAAARAENLHLSKDDRIVVYCASDTCANSHQAAEALRAAGYARVAVYAGGKKDWAEAGLPLDRGGPEV